MDFKAYKNRYGKTLILESGMLDLFESLKNVLTPQGIDIEMTDGWRGEVEQDKDEKEGHSRALFGQSAHNYGVAFDCAPIINGVLSWPSDMTVWNVIGKEGVNLGMVWGGNFHSIVDLPHFELSGWKSLGLKLYSEAPPLSAA